MKYIVPISLVDMDENGCHIIICATVNGKSARMLVDTGASKTVFDVSRVKEFVLQDEFSETPHLTTGLGTNEMKSYWLNIKEFVLNDLVINDFTTVLIDLSNVNETYKMLEEHPIDGVIGGDILLKYKAQIDYGKMQLVLSRRKPVKVL